MPAMILREVAKILAPAVAIYGALLALSLALYPRQSPDALDTARAQETFLGAEPAYLVYSSTLFSSSRPTVVLIGPSSVGMGFPLAEMRRRFRGVDIHNTAIGGTRIDGMAAVVDLVYASRPPAARRNLVFVFGLWYGEFMHSGRSREASHVAQQMARFGLFRAGSGGFERAVGAPFFDAAVTLLRPFFLAHGALRQGSRLMATLTGEHYRGVAPTTRVWTCDNALRRDIVRAHDANFSQVGPSQFLELIDVAGQVRRMGGTLVMVDMPQSRCFTSVAPHWKDYQAIKGPFMAAAVAKGAVYLDLTELDADADFVDVTHPSPRGAAKWTERLATTLVAEGLIATD
jgi:hypothetical protein